MIVRTLAVKQPFAGLIANGTKTSEYRSWSTEYRGPILIVASRTRDRAETEKARRRGKLTSTDEPKGATLCVVDLVSIRWSEANGDFAWKLARPRLVPVTPIKGKLNLYKETVPDDWTVYFGDAPMAAPPVKGSARKSAKRIAAAPAKPRRAATTKPRDTASVAEARRTYHQLLREWRAAGCPDGPMVSAVSRAERAWKGPRP
jgi:hypothetical protein